MKPLRLILPLLFSLLILYASGQNNPLIVSRLMRSDTGLILLKRAQTDRYIIAVALDKATHKLYLINSYGETWDSLQMQPREVERLVSQKLDPFANYKIKLHEGIIFQNELIRQFREYGKLDSLSPIYEIGIANFPEFRHADSISAIKNILKLERQNLRDSIYAWGIDAKDPKGFIKGEVYENNDVHKPGDRFSSEDTLFFVNPEKMSRVHLAILVRKESKISYYDRQGALISRFKLDPNEMRADFSKQDVFRNCLVLLESGKIMLDRRLASYTKAVGTVRYANLATRDKATADLLARMENISKKLDYALNPDLDALRTQLRENYKNVPANNEWLSFIGISDFSTPPSWDSLGNKRYELTNHLGNVMATISDARTSVSGYFKPIIQTAQDYYGFGALMPGRIINTENTRYGFNGKENDNDVKGLGNQQDYGMRIYDPRVGRFLSIDPLIKKYPELTPYQFASNSPVAYLDQDGLESIQIKLAVADAILKVEHWWNNSNPTAGNITYGYQQQMGGAPGSVPNQKATNGDAVIWGIASGMHGFNSAGGLGGYSMPIEDEPPVVPSTNVKNVEETTPNVQVNKTSSQIHNGNEESAEANSGAQKKLVNQYKTSIKQNAKTGFSSDHIPSFASLKYVETQRLRRSLTAAEENTLKMNSLVFTIKTELHVSTSETFGGRNTQNRIINDAANPLQAIRNNVNAYRSDLNKAGYSNAEIDKVIEELSVPFQKNNKPASTPNKVQNTPGGN